jgi:hypothetical protein
MRFYIIAALVVGLMACEKKKEEESEALGSGSLRGTWTSECRELDDVYLQSSFKFLAETFSFSNGTYQDEDCESISDIIEGRGTYLPGGEVTDEDGDVLTEIDYVFEELTWTFEAQPALAADWSAACEDAEMNGNEVNVLGKTCATEDGDLVFIAEQFGTVWTSADMLYASDINTNGASAEDRSLVLDKEFGAMEREAEED